MSICYGKMKISALKLPSSFEYISKILLEKWIEGILS